MTMTDEDRDRLIQARDDIEKRYLAEVLGTVEGRYVIGRYIGMGDLYDTYEEKSLDAAKVQRQLGRRDVSLKILDEVLEVDPRAYIVIQQEMDDFARQFFVDEEDQTNDD